MTNQRESDQTESNNSIADRKPKVPGRDDEGYADEDTVLARINDPSAQHPGTEEASSNDNKTDDTVLAHINE